MDDYIDQLIANLKVLASVPSAGRLSVRRGMLSVDVTVHGQCLVRFWHGDSRDSTLQHVKNTVVGATKIACGLLEARGEPGRQDLWTLERLSEEMERAEAGLRNLRATYSADSGMTASLAVVSERLAALRADIVRFIGGRGASLRAPQPVSDDDS